MFDNMELNKVCRTCLLPNQSMLSIYSSIQPGRLAVFEILKILTEISISTNDDLPKNICYGCLDKVHQLYDFMLMCEKSEAILKQLMDDRKRVKELMTLPNEYERRTESDMKIIKTENIEDYHTSNDYQFEQTSLPESFQHDVTCQAMPIAQTTNGDRFEVTSLSAESFEHNVAHQALPIVQTSNNYKFEQSSLPQMSLSQPSLPERFQHDVTRQAISSTSNDYKFEQMHLPQTSLSQTSLSQTSLPQTNLPQTSLPKSYQHGITHQALPPVQTSDVYKFEELSFEHDVTPDVTHEGTSILQEIKQEEEIDLNMDEEDFNETDPDVVCLDNVLQCKLCTEVFDDEEILKMHTEECSKTFRFERKSKILNFKCPICSKAFGDKHNLAAHVSIHTGEKPFHCELCSKNFRLNVYLTNHMRSVHGAELKCAICYKIFVHKEYLNAHMRIHTGEMPFECKKCPEKFPLNTYLIAHMETVHAKGRRNIIRKFKCAICMKLFGYKQHLFEHMRVHSEEKPFKCDECQKTFRFKSGLRSHTQTAHGDGKPNKRKYKCPTCSKLYTNNQNLKAHITLHTGEKPFKCELCPNRFRIIDYMICHMQRVHGVKSQCGEDSTVYIVN